MSPMRGSPRATEYITPEKPKPFSKMNIRPKGKTEPGEIKVTGRCPKCGHGVRQFFSNSLIIEDCEACGHTEKHSLGKPRYSFPADKEVSKNAM